jgi:hypothetical protein
MMQPGPEGQSTSETDRRHDAGQMTPGMARRQRPDGI